MSLRVSLSYPGLCRTLLTSLRSYFQLLWYMLCTEEGSATWWCTSTQNSAVNIFCQAPVQSPDFSLGTRSWLCFPPVTTTTRTNKNPHQNLAEGEVLEIRNLTHKLLMGYWLSLGSWGSEGPISQEEQEEQAPPPKSIRRGCTRSLKFDI